MCACVTTWRGQSNRESYIGVRKRIREYKGGGKGSRRRDNEVWLLLCKLWRPWKRGRSMISRSPKRLGGEMSVSVRNPPPHSVTTIISSVGRFSKPEVKIEMYLRPADSFLFTNTSRHFSFFSGKTSKRFADLRSFGEVRTRVTDINTYIRTKSKWTYSCNTYVCITVSSVRDVVLLEMF